MSTLSERDYYSLRRAKDNVWGLANEVVEQKRLMDRAAAAFQKALDNYAQLIRQHADDLFAATELVTGRPSAPSVSAALRAIRIPLAAPDVAETAPPDQPDQAPALTDNDIPF